MFQFVSVIHTKFPCQDMGVAIGQSKCGCIDGLNAEEEWPEDEGWLEGGEGAEEGWEVDDGVDDGVDPVEECEEVEWRHAEEEAQDVARTVEDLGAEVGRRTGEEEEEEWWGDRAWWWEGVW